MSVIPKFVMVGLFVLGGPSVRGADSETPPEGPPWQRDLVKARELAADGDKPIFVYFTKTY